ncbi:MAG: hypothetical protein P8Y78_08515, partial [Acidihalobacter sp.]
VREVARQGQAILGVRFFRRFLCAFQRNRLGRVTDLDRISKHRIAPETGRHRQQIRRLQSPTIKTTTADSHPKQHPGNPSKGAAQTGAST